MSITSVKTGTTIVLQDKPAKPCPPGATTEQKCAPALPGDKLDVRKVSTSEHVVRFVGSTTLSTFAGAAGGAGAGLLIGSSLAGGMGGAIGLYVGGTAGALVGGVNGMAVGKIVEGKGKGTLLGAAIGGAMGAAYGAFSGGGAAAIMFGLTGAAAGAASGFTSAALQKK